MSKLWDKGVTLDKEVESFTVGKDYLLDEKLVFYDCMGSLAHARMLHKIGVINLDEWATLHEGLIDVMQEEGFKISVEDEDVHTAVENYLIESHGKVGKKLHTARSRNDQVSVDLRLYMKDSLRRVMEALLGLADQWAAFAQKGEKVPIPGRTHMQPAMPSSFGLWGGSYLESLLDNATLLQQSYDLIDQSPLGAGSSYGVNLPIDREYTASLLGFKRVQNNSLYAISSRGKFEAVVVHLLAQIMNDLGKAASDLIFFSLPEIGYLNFPEQYASGSSLMPQKKNPCVLELVRAKGTKVNAHLHTLLELTRPLTSGYHRDLQETKEPLMASFEMTLGALSVMKKVVKGAVINREACKQSFKPELFATDAVLRLVEQGIPFREAYKKIGTSLDAVPLEDALQNILAKRHLGATGNLGLNLSYKKMEGFAHWLMSEAKDFKLIVQNLTKKGEQ